MGHAHSGSLLWWLGSLIPARPVTLREPHPKGGQTDLPGLTSARPAPRLARNGMRRLCNRKGWEPTPEGLVRSDPPPRRGRGLRVESCLLLGRPGGAPLQPQGLR